MTSYRRILLAALDEELARRQPQPSSATDDPRTRLFDQQRAAWDDPSRWQAWPCGRQAGKTHLIEETLLTTAQMRPGEKAFYLSTTIKRAVGTIWDELVAWNHDRGLGGRPNHSHHTITMPRGGQVIVTGVENQKMANDIRGRRPVALYVIDEAQDWRNDLLRYFYDRVVFPGLVTVKGRVIVSGTGGAPKGWWYDRTRDANWAKHSWSTLQNPRLPEGEAQALIDKAMWDRGVDINDPSIQREFFAKFVVDTARQIFPVTEANLYDPKDLPGWQGEGRPLAGKWYYVVAADFGSVDATAVVVWGWTASSPHLWVLESVAKRDLGSSGQIALVRGVIERYRTGLMAVVGDPGGGGKGHIIDLQRQHQIHMIPAEKEGKATACLTLRDGMRAPVGSPRVKLPRADAALVSDIQEPEWDPDNVGKAVRGHFPDRVDALLYGWRAAAPMHQYTAPVVDTRTPEKWIDDAFKAGERRKAAALRRLGLG